jgi:hypothetical protein
MMTKSLTMVNAKQQDERSRYVALQIARAEATLHEGNFDGAEQAFKEAADMCFDTGEIDVAMHLLDRIEDARQHKQAGKASFAGYLASLQEKVDKAITAGKPGQARDLLKQMLAIAVQSRDVDTIKGIQVQLDAVTSTGTARKVIKK